MQRSASSFRVGDTIKGSMIEEALSDGFFGGVLAYLPTAPSVMFADAAKERVRQQIMQNLRALVRRRVLQIIRTAQENPELLQGDYVAEHMLTFAVTPEKIEKLADTVAENSADPETEALLSGLLSEDDLRERNILERLMRAVNGQPLSPTEQLYAGF